jgi:hypothetical protein
MQRIHNTQTNTTVWRGPAYLVDGHPGVVEMPLALLDEVTDETPDYDPETETVEWSEGPDLDAMTWHRKATVRDLSDDELAERNRPHRVSKDTMTMRIAAAGKVADSRAMIAAMPDEQRWLFEQLAWFHSDNAELRAGLAAIGLDPDEILAPDPFL